MPLLCYNDRAVYTVMSAEDTGQITSAESIHCKERSHSPKRELSAALCLSPASLDLLKKESFRNTLILSQGRLAQTILFLFFMLFDVQNRSKLELPLKHRWSQECPTARSDGCTFLGNQLLLFQTRNKKEDVNIQSLKINTHTYTWLCCPSKHYCCRGEA